MGRGARFGEGAVGLDSEVWCVGEKRKEEKWGMAWRPGETMVGLIFLAWSKLGFGLVSRLACILQTTRCGV